MAVFTKQASIKAKQALIDAGWMHVCSTMNDCGNGEYGSLFIKGGEKFWFNKDTFNKLPV